MPSDTFEQLLDRAASLSGIEPGYWDIWGRYHSHHARPPNRPSCRRWALRPAIPSNWNIRWPLSPAANGNGWRRRPWCAANPGEQELPLNLPVESLGERARIVIRREDGQSASFS